MNYAITIASITTFVSFFTIYKRCSCILSHLKVRQVILNKIEHLVHTVSSKRNFQGRERGKKERGKRGK